MQPLSIHTRISSAQMPLCALETELNTSDVLNITITILQSKEVFDRSVLFDINLLNVLQYLPAHIVCQ